MAGNSINFQTGMRSIVKGDILIAPLRSYLSSPTFKGFDLKVRGIGERPPDFYFHPSEHPGWPVRALWLWMVAPTLLMREPREPTSTLAMTAGSIWHEVVERSLLDIGLLVTNEVGFQDEALRSRGHADGLVKEHSGQGSPEELFEFKTMKDMILRRIETLDDFIAKYPTYHVQANEYMRMSGYRKMRFLLMALTFPFEMKEFVLPYDESLALAVVEKYTEVHQSIADRRVPLCDGCPKSFHCAARPVCESATDKQLELIVKNAKPVSEAH